MNEIAILIADDEALERRALTKIIQEMNISGLELYEAENGRAVLDTIQQRKIHILLLDIKMPGLDGINTARQIRLLSPGTRIIFVTAFSEFDYAREAIRLGVEEYLVKPVSREVVQSTLNTLIQQILQQEGEENSGTLAENLLQQEVEAALGREELANDTLDTYLRLRQFQWKRRYVLSVVHDCEKRGNDLNKVRILFKKNFNAQHTLVLAGIHEARCSLHAVIFFIKDVTGEEIQQELAHCLEDVRVNLGIQIYCVVMEWKQGEIQSMLQNIQNYRSLVNFVFPVLILTSEIQTAFENPRGKIAKVIEYLKQHLAQDVSLEEAARVVGLSPFHVSHLFKTYQGETFVQVYTRLRIETAKQLLKDGHYSIKEICGMLGFKEQAYFTRVFKKREGISPAMFQKQYMK